jgi:hypothetical protein
MHYGLMATKQRAPIPRQESTASRIRACILADGERFWTYKDFDVFPLGTAAQALSRLTKEGILQRTGKGLYYRPRQTSLGKSRPSQARTAELSAKHTLHPSGIAAANILGFTTQNAARPQFATSGTNAPTKFHGSKVYTRRPVERDNLSIEDGALLEFLRARGNTSELSAEQTARKLVKELRDQKRFQRIATAARAEPPRVRAMLGAIAEETKQPKPVIESLRQSLNELSRFDFGLLRALKYAERWQAK